MIDYEQMFNTLKEEIRKILIDRKIEEYVCPVLNTKLDTETFRGEQLFDIAKLCGFNDYEHQYMKLW